MSGGQVFPRSLDPLAEESLIGYVVRLAHRLERPLTRILWLSGLTGHSGAPLPLKHMVALPADRVARFAEATRLTEHEATALTLADLRGRYPPLKQYNPGSDELHHRGAGMDAVAATRVRSARSWRRRSR